MVPLDPAGRQVRAEGWESGSVLGEEGRREVAVESKRLDAGKSCAVTG